MNSKIKALEIYVPPMIKTNADYIAHFEKQDKNIAHLLEAYGKSERHIVTKGEDTSLTLGLKAAKKALQQAHVSIDEIGLVIFASQVPEYTIPSQSFALYGLLNGKGSPQTFDVNMNCAGMVNAFIVANALIHINPLIKYALVIGADYMSYISEPTDEYNYPMVGDSGCALLLESTEEEHFIDYAYSMNAEHWEFAKFPRNGLSHLEYFKDSTLIWDHIDARFAIEIIDKVTQELLDKHHYTRTDIKGYYISQFAKPIIECYRDLLGPSANIPYVGNHYGYTGVTSPFLALYEDIQAGIVKPGDIISLSSVGAIWTIYNIILRL